MKISYNWLKEFIEITESPEDLGKILTSTGLEVEAVEEIESIKGGLRGFVVGKVLTCERFEVKEKTLSLTTVDIGLPEPSTIVCGAPNVAAGQTVIVATVGTTIHLADGTSFDIAKRKVYGHPSEGMICAEDEIGIGKGHEGILIIDTPLPTGTPAAEFFKLSSDHCIEIGLTPNRSDAAGHYGVARDLKAKLHREITLPSVAAFQPTAQKSAFKIHIENAEACPRFCGLELENVQVGPSPEWLQNYLKAVGVNPINNVVDVTNYICHGLGQPMHAFDAEEIIGQQIIVKTVAENTPFITLDGKERKLLATDLMICNAAEPMSIAGTFGGLKSGIKDTTKRVFLEVAYFDPTWIRRTATHHGLKTDASFRYERGTDPNMPPYAIQLAAALLHQIAGATAVGDVQDLQARVLEPVSIVVKHKNINRLIGKNVDDRLVEKILTDLDFSISEATKEQFTVAVPLYRVDVTREADVIEEILRIYGFDQINEAENLKADYLSNFPTHAPADIQQRVSQILAGAGQMEVMNLSIVSAKQNLAIEEALAGTPIDLLNPLSEDLNQMRGSLLFSGLGTLLYNINRKQNSLKIFEFGRVYFSKTSPEGKKSYKERTMLGLWQTGTTQSENWKNPSKNTDFFDLKQLVENVAKSMRIKLQYTESESTIFSYGLDVVINKKKIGQLGCVSKKILKQADIKQEVFYAELDWDYLLKQYSNDFTYTEIPKFPEVRRDLSLVLDDSVHFAQIENLAFKLNKGLLKEVSIFDIFKGESLGEGKKAYSVSFVLQNTLKTLEDQEIDSFMGQLIKGFENELKAVIRK